MEETERYVTFYQCRACRTFNDFEGIDLAINSPEARNERALNDPETRNNGSFVMLADYECAGYGFTMSPAPMWFVTKAGDEPVFLESGFIGVRFRLNRQAPR